MPHQQQSLQMLHALQTLLSWAHDVRTRFLQLQRQDLWVLHACQSACMLSPDTMQKGMLGLVGSKVRYVCKTCAVRP